MFHRGDVLVKRYDKSSEELVDVGEDEVGRGNFSKGEVFFGAWG